VQAEALGLDTALCGVYPELVEGLRAYSTGASVENGKALDARQEQLPAQGIKGENP